MRGFITRDGIVDEVLNPEQAGQLLQLKPYTVRRYASWGKLPSIKKGKRLFFLKSQILEYILSGSNQASAS
jgi:predicted site-specific integrase-resolvase